MARSAPSRAQPSAIARPMPLDAPVTSTIFPSSLTPPPPARSPALTSRIPTYQGHSNSQGSKDAAVGERAVGQGSGGRGTGRGRDHRRQGAEARLAGGG